MAELRRLTTCKGCGKQIGFIKTVNGKTIPVDPEPICFMPEEGYDKFVMMDGTMQRGRALEEADKTAIGYRSHFATCPAADTFRRKKNKSERVKEND